MKITTPQLSKRAIAILRKVQKAIVAEPTLYSQSIPFRPNAECGSPSCICGWLDLFLRPKGYRGVRWQSINIEAGASLLGGEVGTARYYRLFNLHEWPLRYKSRWYALTRPTKARRASRRIDHFIKTGGAE